MGLPLLSRTSSFFGPVHFSGFPHPQHRGVAKHNMTFLVSTLFALAGSLLLLIGASIWTVIVQRAAAINHLVVTGSGGQTTPLGILVSTGPGLFLTWAAFACLVVSVVPYMIRYDACITYVIIDSTTQPPTAAAHTDDSSIPDGWSKRNGSKNTYTTRGPRLHELLMILLMMNGTDIYYAAHEFPLSVLY